MRRSLETGEQDIRAETRNQIPEIKAKYKNIQNKK